MEAPRAKEVEGGRASKARVEIPEPDLLEEMAAANAANHVKQRRRRRQSGSTPFFVYEIPESDICVESGVCVCFFFSCWQDVVLMLVLSWWTDPFLVFLGAATTFLCCEAHCS